MVNLSANGIPLTRFVIRNMSDDPAVDTAVKELNHYLKPQAQDGKGTIYVGLASDIPQLADCAKKVEEEGVLIRIDGESVYIAGGSGRGTLYAAYEFLERFCGWRFFTPELETEPKKDADLTDTTYLYNPVFHYRMNLVPSVGENESLFQKRHLNAKWGPVPLPDEVGGSITCATNNAHTLRELLPDEIYFDAHPEYYAMNENGERARDPQNGTMPCLSNPEVFDIVLENLRKEIKAHPKARYAGVSQTDGPMFCHCPECTKVNEEEETNGGTIYRFLNRIAKTLKDEFPHIMFETHPYVYSTKPPAHEVLADNVAVRLSLMDICREHALSDESCRFNKAILTYIDGWKTKCKNLYLFEYAANFHNYPISIPNFKCLYQNLKRFRCYPITGVTYLGAHTTVPDIEFCEMWTYLQSKLLWEPDMTYAQYVQHAKEFMQAQYGEGWSYIYDYLMLYMLQPSSDIHYGPAAYCEWIIPMLTLPNGDPDMTFIRDGNELFDLAEQVATGKALDNVKRTRLHLVWYELCTTYKGIRKKGNPEQVEALRKKYCKFVETVSQWEHFRINEGEPFDGIFDFEKDPNSYIPKLGTPPWEES